MAFPHRTRKRGGANVHKNFGVAALQRRMEFEFEGRIGAGRRVRSGERTTQRDGFRERDGSARLRTLELKIPELREHGVFPPFSSRARPPGGLWPPWFGKPGCSASGFSRTGRSPARGPGPGSTRPT
jgi:hypothetical protein